MNVSSGKRERFDIDMRTFAKSAGATVKVPAGSVVFNKGDAGNCMYIVQAGVIDMMIDEQPRSSTARAKEACELSLIDARTFRFMVDEVPNFASYIMGALARRIRGMGRAM